MGEILDANEKLKEKLLLQKLKVVGLSLLQVGITIGGAKLLEYLSGKWEVEKVDVSNLYGAAKDGAKVTAQAMTDTLFELVDLGNNGDNK